MLSLVGNRPETGRTANRFSYNVLHWRISAMDVSPTSPFLFWTVRLLFVGSALAYAAHLYLVWRQIRQATAAAFGPATARRHRVRVQADVLLHRGEGFLLRDVLPAPYEP